MQAGGHDARWLDAADLQLPLCDGDSAWGHESARRLKEAVEAADGIVIALGVYNFGPSAVAKTLVELGGGGWRDKVVGFACSAGGPRSYMAVMGLASSLMLDFRCLIVPRFVFAVGSAFDGDDLMDADVSVRVNELVDELVRITEAVRGRGVGSR
jgi:FMN reductase